MEIYFMPDMKLAYLVSNVGNGNKFLSDSKEFVPLSLSQAHSDSDRDDVIKCDEAIIPTEIFMVGLGNYNRRPLLFIRTRNDLLIYQVSERGV